MKNNAILMPARIGEFVLALSVVQRKMHESGEQLTLIVPQHLIPLCTLLTPLPYFPFRRGSRSELAETIAGVKRQGFDMLYLLATSFAVSWFAINSGIPVRRGISRSLFTNFLTEKVPPPQMPDGIHITAEYAQILEVPHVEPEDWPGITIRNQQEPGNRIILCPGIGHGVPRGWQGFREIVKLLPSYEFTILGGNDDLEAAKSVATHLPHRVQNLAGKTSLEAAAGHLSSAAVVISNHSGLMQLAGFLGTPVVGIFGATSGTRFKPLGQHVRCAVGESTCLNCNRGTCERKDHACFESITPEQIIALAGEIVRHP